MLSKLLEIKNKKHKVLTRNIVSCFFLFSFFFTFKSSAQCAMCRASLESTGDTAKVEAVNDGIVFLMAIPYILVAIIGFVIYKMYSKKTKA
jgi:heme/copper-type cytochrome/quinol oxidase subunit 2